MGLNRIFYLSLLLVAFIFVFFYGGKVPYMLLYTVLALPIVSLLHLVLGYLGLKFEQGLDSSSVVKGDKVTYTFRIANRSLFLLPYVSIKFFGDADMLKQQQDIKNLALRPLEKRQFCFEYGYKYRGCYEIGVNALEIQDFLGVFKLVRRMKQPLLITVYPRIIDINRIGLNTYYVPDQLLTKVSLYQDVSEIEDINKYSYGDNLKNVHWKLSAKVNELMVKKYQPTAAASALFFVDLKSNALTGESDALIEDKHIESAVAVLNSFLQSGAAVKLIYHDGEIRSLACSSPLDFEPAYEKLAKVKFKQEASFKDIIESQINNSLNKPDILLSTSNVDYGLYETLCRYKSVGYDLSLIYIPLEEITGARNPEVDQILSALSVMGINVFSINLNDDLVGVSEYGGRPNW